MRKRVVIGLVAIAIFGLLAHTLSQPKKGSLEWHKRKYLEAWDRLTDKHWRGRLATFVAGRTGRFPKLLLLTRDEYTFWNGEFYLHRDALMDMGYLSEKVIRFSNVSPKEVDAGLRAVPRPLPEDERFTSTNFETNAVRIIAPALSMTLWEDCVRRLDVPRSGR